jgi:mannose-6-phosphate isomerase-like protein (cupin superfamily)
MPHLIPQPTSIASAGNKPKLIEEFIGRVNSADERLSIARMRSPAGWIEPAQRPDFDEYTLVLKGLLLVESGEERIEVREGQAIVVRQGERVRYSTPEPEGAEYIAVCLPAFSPDTVHRDASSKEGTQKN